MAASFLCHDCIPEGTKLSLVPLLSIEAGPPGHCHGKNNRTTPGLIGGYLCSCSCAQRPRDSGQDITPPNPSDNGRNGDPL